MEVAAPDLSRICGIALNEESENNSIDVRDHQPFWLGVKTNLKGYNPASPDAVLPALADISAHSKAIRVLQEHDIVVRISDTERNRTWKYIAFNMDVDNI